MACHQLRPFDSRIGQPAAVHRSLRAFDCGRMARHERSLRFAEGERKLSRMVEAAGVETEISKLSNLLMARDF